MIPESAMDPVGKPASDFTVPTRDGGEFKLSAQKGKVVIISFWASWCTPCRNELPALAKLARERPEFTYIAVNVDRAVRRGRRSRDRDRRRVGAIPVLVGQLKIDLPAAETLFAIVPQAVAVDVMELEAADHGAFDFLGNRPFLEAVVGRIIPI
jgi:thiol-disulfide isomerase/thioredoxin